MRENRKDTYTDTNEYRKTDPDELEDLSISFLDMEEEDAEEGSSAMRRRERSAAIENRAAARSGKKAPEKESGRPEAGKKSGRKEAYRGSSSDDPAQETSDGAYAAGDYGQIRRSAEARKREQQRNSRRRERDRAVRRAKTVLAVVIGGAAVTAFVLIRAAWHGNTAVPAAEAAEIDSGVSTAIGAVALGTADFESTEAATEEDTGPELPDEAQIAADRAAKNYSEDVASFWPYYWFYEDDSTQLIPCEAAFRELGLTVPAAGSTQESSTASSKESSEEERTASAAADTESAEAEDTAGESSTEAATESSTETAAPDPYIIGDGDDTFTSQYGILVNADTGEIVAKKNPYARIVPASMTKVMTLLVAVEAMTDPTTQMQQMVTLTQANEEYAYVNDSSAVCWMPGDTATVADLMYGTILPSGADAAVALAEYTAGSQEEFVKLMNAKAQELGLTDTHFTNCVGIYDEDHYSTPYEIAVIMKAAMENDICRQVLSTHTWTTSPTSEHPEGITVSNWFLRRIEDFDNHGTVLCAKTGYVEQSGFCGVSYQISNDGTHYILCSADTFSSWKCIYDHTAIYQEYTK